eukprot:TRINITY_DN6810_c0_g1_i2.p1 TRINITY_DN6810_c0_g1~~TRINITY_DN6810_c0_g1_i2.p1  ORF type:complete len:105 (-),score=5.68 TRINITY_DN6810_c0_g1_i2:94-408(-)
MFQVPILYMTSLVQKHAPLQYMTRMTTSSPNIGSIIILINDDPDNIKSKSMFHYNVTPGCIQQVQKHVPSSNPIYDEPCPKACSITIYDKDDNKKFKSMFHCNI